MLDERKIHNFCIVAHIDHGKSTLADRLLEITHTVEARKMRDQMLDQMELEREKGITIKLQPVRMMWDESEDGQASSSQRTRRAAKEVRNNAHMLNLIDTPGHVDFQYEVSRSLQAVEGAVLLVDATQGVQAQTISNLYLAVEAGLEIIPVINKIDLPAAQTEEVKQQIVDLIGGKSSDILMISAKTGAGVDKVIHEIVRRVPIAQQSVNEPLRALIFDSVYNEYKGVVAYVRIVEGSVRGGDQISFMGTDMKDNAVEVGIMKPQWQKTDRLAAGEIGYIATGLKDVRQARVGDTIVLAADKAKLKALPGFAVPQPKLFAGVYPADGDKFSELREAIEELQLNDASLHVQVEQSEALGRGFRCGFLGMLHLEIVQERLRREWGVELVVTTPSVLYRVQLTEGTVREAQTPAEWPDASSIAQVEEQFVRTEVIVPKKYMGAVFELFKQREGEMIKQEYIGSDRLMVEYEMPLRELVVDLYDQLKSVTAGYGSLSYVMGDWRVADVVKLNILVNREVVEALSVIVPRIMAAKIGRRMVDKLKKVLPKQQFTVPLQAAVGGDVVARETLSALRKDVTGYLYGGDVTRKRKLLEKQKKGKKKLAGVATVRIPANVYIEVLKSDTK